MASNGDARLDDILQTVKDEQQEYFESKLEDFATRQPSQGDIESFRREVDSTIESVDERITELREERDRLIQKKQKIKKEFNQFGEKDLEALRNKGAGRFKLDLYDLGEEGIEGQLRMVNRKMNEFALFRSALHRVKEETIYQRWAELDAQSIRAKVHEKFSDLQEKKFDDLEGELERLEEKLEGRVESIREDSRKERRRFREAIREERRSDRDKLYEVLREFGRSLDQNGLNSSKLEDRIDELAQRLEGDVVSVDEESERLEHSEGNDGSDDSHGSGEENGGSQDPHDLSVEKAADEYDLSESKTQLLRELRKENRSEDLDRSLRDIADEIDGISYGTVKAYKKELRDQGLIEDDS